MREFSFAEVKQYDIDHGTNFLEQIREVVDKQAQEGHGLGVFCQLRTDWTLE